MRSNPCPLFIYKLEHLHLIMDNLATMGVSTNVQRYFKKI